MVLNTLHCFTFFIACAFIAVKSAHVAFKADQKYNDPNEFLPGGSTRSAKHISSQQTIPNLNRWASASNRPSPSISVSKSDVLKHSQSPKENAAFPTPDPSKFVDSDVMPSESEAASSMWETESLISTFEVSPEEETADNPLPAAPSLQATPRGSQHASLSPKSSQILQSQVISAQWKHYQKAGEETWKHVVSDPTESISAHPSSIIGHDRSEKGSGSRYPISAISTSFRPTPSSTFQQMYVHASVPPTPTDVVQEPSQTTTEAISASSSPEPSRGASAKELPQNDQRRPVVADFGSVSHSNFSDMTKPPLISPAVFDGEEEFRFSTTADPTETEYQPLEVGESINYRMKPGILFYNGPRIGPDIENEAQLVLVYSNIGGFSEKFVAKRKDNEGETKERYRKQLKIVAALQKTNYATKHESFLPPLHLYAFRGDPLSSNPTLIAAATTQMLTENASKTSEVLVDVPVSDEEHLYLVVAVSSSTELDVEIRSTLHRVTIPPKRPWNAIALQENPITASTELPKPIRSFVYVLSSVPYARHTELDGTDMDLSGLSDLAASMKSTEVDPFCNPKGTEIAGALAGKNLGISRTATIVPVPIESCSKAVSGQTLKTAFMWSHRHMTQQKRSRFFVIIQDSHYSHRQLGPALPIIEKMRIQGAIIYLPSSSCAFPNEALYLNVGPYGRRNDGAIEVPNMNDSCLHGFDTFAPGLQVLGTSTSGPYAYRNIAISSDIAAAGAVALTINALQLRDGFIDTSNLQRIFRSEVHPSIAFVRGSKHSEMLSVLRAKSMRDLAAAFASFFETKPQNNDNKAGSTIIPNLPNSALIGICASAGVVIFAVLLAGILVMRRSRMETSESSYATTTTSYPESGGEDPAIEKSGLDNTMATDATPVGAHEIPREANPPDRTKAIVVHALGQKENDHSMRVPIVQRLLSFAGSKNSSPTTPNAKVSWFATPKGHQNGDCVFNGKAGSSQSGNAPD